MENHPIPQDVTGFQFRLIGDMTVKQFAYLAVCIFFAWFFYAVLPFPALVKLPFSALIAGFGAALAFMPIEGRPMDIMVGNFVKALFTPNQYIYQKIGGQLLILTIQAQPIQTAQEQQDAVAANPANGQKLNAYLSTIHSGHITKLDEKEANYVNSLFTNQPYLAVAHSSTPVPVIVQPLVPTIPPVISQKNPVESEEKPKETPLPIIVTPIAADTSSLQTEQQTHSELPPVALDTLNQNAPIAPVQGKSNFADDLYTMKQEIEQAKGALDANPNPAQALPQLENQDTPQVVEQPVVEDPQPVAELSSNQVSAPTKSVFDQAKANMKEKLPIPEFPNVVTGIVKNPRGNILPNILIEIKDKEGSPVRAFKTNGLGQFASATALSNGTYTIELEDPKNLNKFAALALTVEGKIIQPIEIRSSDEREELRKSLFN